MKRHLISSCVIGFLVLAGCGGATEPAPKPNLVVQSFDQGSHVITEANIGNADAGAHLTYVEINEVGVSDTDNPQCQYSLKVPRIAAGGTWQSEQISFSTSSFSCPTDRGGPPILDRTTVNLVVRVDAKAEVDESNESDNIFSTQINLH